MDTWECNVNTPDSSLKDDFLESVDVEWKDYTTAESFFSQEPQDIKSLLGAMSLDLCILLKQEHLHNIKNNVAKKIGSFEQEKSEDVKLSKV